MKLLAFKDAKGERWDEVMGQLLHKEALVVDTRFNGGGNLHEQLSDVLSGKKDFDVIPRGQNYGFQPMGKWNKPSIVVMGEGNDSDGRLVAFGPVFSRAACTLPLLWITSAHPTPR